MSHSKLVQFDPEVIHVAARKVYRYMIGRRHSASPEGVSGITLPVPDFSLEETRKRFFRKHLLNNSRNDDPTTRYLLDKLRQGFDAMKNQGIDGETCLLALTTTLAVLRLGGNTKAWIDAVGYLSDWSNETQNRVKFLWVEALRDKDLAEKYFDDGLKPTKLLRKDSGIANHNYMKGWKHVDRILSQIHDIRTKVVPTLYQLAPFSLPWEQYCTIFKGVAYHGIGGQGGYQFAGAYHTDPVRLCGLWSKEMVLDMMGTERVFHPSYLPSDHATFTPVGLKSWEGFLLASGLNAEYPIEHAVEAYRLVLALQGSYGFTNLWLHDIQWAFCEYRKFSNQSSRLRRSLRNSVKASAQASQGGTNAGAYEKTNEGATTAGNAQPPPTDSTASAPHPAGRPGAAATGRTALAPQRSRCKRAFSSNTAEVRYHDLRRCFSSNMAEEHCG